MSCSTSSSETPRRSTASRKTSMTCSVSARRVRRTARRAAARPGLAASARAISTSRVMPSESAGDRLIRDARQVQRLEQDCRPARSPRCPAGRKPRAVTMSDQIRDRLVLTRWARMMCSRTVRPPNTSGCWNVRARPSRARCCGAGPGDVGAVEHDRPRVRAAQPGQHREQGALARAVRPDEARRWWPAGRRARPSRRRRRRRTGPSRPGTAGGARSRGCRVASLIGLRCSRASPLARCTGPAAAGLDRPAAARSPGRPGAARPSARLSACSLAARSPRPGRPG